MVEPRTTVVRREDVLELPAEVRRRTSGFRNSDVLALVSAGIGSIAATAGLFIWIAPFSGVFGFIVVAWVIFLALYALLVSFDESGPAVRDRLAKAIVHSAALVLVAGLFDVVGYTFYRGHDAVLRHDAHTLLGVRTNFVTQDLRSSGALQPLTAGGIKHAIVGSLIEITIALAIVVPLGVLCALYISETKSAFSRVVRTIVEAMTALPSVVAGLFIYASWILAFHQGKSGFAASLAISVMMLPIVVRTSDVVLRLVPASLKEASLAVGAGQWRTVWHVTLPTARSGLATAIILGTARGIGETSPVLLTAGYGTATNWNPFHGPMVSLPLVTFELIKTYEHNQVIRGFGAACVLLILVLLAFILARIAGGRGAGVLSKRQRDRAVQRSQRTARRFDKASAGSGVLIMPSSSTRRPRFPVRRTES